METQNTGEVNGVPSKIDKKKERSISLSHVVIAGTVLCVLMVVLAVGVTRYLDAQTLRRKLHEVRQETAAAAKKKADAEAAATASSGPSGPIGLVGDLPTEISVKIGFEVGNVLPNVDLKSMPPTQTLTLPGDSTVENALEASGVTYKAQGGAVLAIDGVANGAFGVDSGWYFLVNGTFPLSTFKNCRLTDGDTLRWVYSLNGGDDINTGQ